ncbi:uncharacterized protein TNCV_3392751 [Trichonephila clavipes]|nr:uncharacterized protein TNCV_3392751 [Trichonephila clavipes]
MSEEQLDTDAGSFRSYYPYGLNVIWKGESVLLTFKQKSEDSLYIPNFDKSIDNSNNIGFARISRAKRRKRVTRDMATLKNSMLELAVKFADNYNTGLIKSFMIGMNKTEIKIMTDILSRYKFRDSHVKMYLFFVTASAPTFRSALPSMVIMTLGLYSSGLYFESRIRHGCKECFFSSDEAHFWLNGYVNKQNCRIWSEANPQVYVETPLHPEKLTVWCALWAGGIRFQKR